MKKIPLTQGYYALVDDKDFEWLSELKWSVNRKRHSLYAQHAKMRSGKGKIFYMHRLIMNAPKGKQVDHINGNTLDNTRSNLRICSSSENLCNRKAPRQNTSGFKGVSWFERDKKWRARIGAKCKQKTIGYFDTKEEAAKAYDLMAKKLHGSFARLNF